MEADEALARALQAEEEAAAASAPSAAAQGGRDAARADFASRLQSGLATAMQYESRQMRREARAVMPLLQVRPARAYVMTC